VSLTQEVSSDLLDEFLEHPRVDRVADSPQVGSGPLAQRPKIRLLPELVERLPGDLLYWDATDPRPWGTWLNISDERYKRYREILEAEGN
jgi:hypothetical protein